ncbi:MAG: hypothetical protein AAF348_16305 [Bacteroidota bacterium]
MEVQEKSIQEKLSERLETSKKKLNELKDYVSASEKNHNESLEKLKSTIDKKAKEVKGDFSKAIKRIKKKKSDLKGSIAHFKQDATMDRATKKAEHAEKYAISCIKMVNVAIDKAEIAIANSIVTAIEAEQLRNE